MMFLAPYLSDKQLADLYSQAYFSQTEESASTLAPMPSTTYREAIEIRTPKFEATLDALQRLIPAGGSLLDVGAGTGEFVHLARRRGLEAEGVEFSAFAAEEARKRYGLNLSIGRLGEFAPARQYDAVHLNHVFEHIPDPHAAVKWIDALLAVRGVVYVEVPFQFNVVERTKYHLHSARAPFNLHSLHHPVFFTPQTFIRLFSHHGFKCIKLSLFDWAHYPLKGTLSHLKAVVWRTLAVFGQGLFIEAIFRRERDL